jgi:hypothetical protein
MSIGIPTIVQSLATVAFLAAAGGSAARRVVVSVDGRSTELSRAEDTLHPACHLTH